MGKIDRNSLATIEFELEWKSTDARHTERYLGRKVNIWRDIFPPRMEDALKGLSAGDKVVFEYAPGELVPRRSEKQVFHLSLCDFRQMDFGGRTILPHYGRFYPCGLLRRVRGVFPQNVNPFRITERNESELVVDTNPPLSSVPVRLTARVHNVVQKHSDTGGRLTDWAETLCSSGPGMQVPVNGRPTDFALDAPQSFSRLDEKNDAEFYAQPRITGHIDAQAATFVTEEYMKRLTPGMKVLDLMSSCESHLPHDVNLDVVGLGMSESEMQANSRLTAAHVHDLNADPALPFETASFDAVIISLSIEYLTSPQAVLAEVRRVLRPGGVVLVSFSNRWFPTKVTNLWLELHEFERMGLVTQLLSEAGDFGGFETVSIRNWWRPEDDPHIRETWISDPVYIVAATRE